MTRWLPWSFLATLVLHTGCVCCNVDGQICTDVSYWKPVEYKPVEYRCCQSKVELNCVETNEKVCIPVEEMECQVNILTLNNTFQYLSTSAFLIWNTHLYLQYRRGEYRILIFRSVKVPVGFDY